MTWRAKIAGFFAEKEPSECFVEAKSQLKRLKSNINFVNIEMGDEISPLVFIKNKWQSIPCSLGNKCYFLGLESSPNYNVVLNDMGDNGIMYEHSHTKNYEEILVLEGNLTIQKGDEFIELGPLDKINFSVGDKHTISSKNGARFIIAYSPIKEKAVIYNESIILANNFEQKFDFK